MTAASGKSVVLRRRLAVTLGALAVVAVGCSLVPRHPVAAVPLSAPPAAVATPPPPTAATTPAARPAPLRATGGCALTLGGSGKAVAPGHCTVVEIGDSLGNDLGWGLAREVEPGTGLKLVQLDRSSTGLAVPSYYNWPAALGTALGHYHPQLVIVCLGGNDEQGMEVDGRPVQFGTAAWRSAYVARVHTLAAEATATGAFVLWVGLPIMRDATYDHGSQELDAAFRAGTAGLPRASFVPLRSVFAGPTGAYVAGGLREPDGIHLSYAGENRAATAVLQDISQLYGVTVS